jgi:hypothetical protein
MVNFDASFASGLFCGYFVITRHYRILKPVDSELDKTRKTFVLSKPNLVSNFANRSTHKSISSH